MKLELNGRLAAPTAFVAAKVLPATAFTEGISCRTRVHSLAQISSGTKADSTTVFSSMNCSRSGCVQQGLPRGLLPGGKCGPDVGHDTF